MIHTLTERESTDILQGNYIGRLGYIAASAPHIIPITYYYDQKTKSIISYSLEGHKINAMRTSPLVALQVDEIEAMDQWRSVLVHGTFEEMQQIDAKNLLHEFSQGVKNLINRTSDKRKKDVQFIHEFSSKVEANGSSPIVFRIIIQEITGKQRLD